MKNKKILLIAGAIILLGIALYFIFRPKSPSSAIPPSKLTSEEVELKAKADEAVNKWGNFSDNTSNDYLNSLKPYLSDEAFTAQKEDAEAQKYFNDQAGKPLEQKYTIKKIELISRGEEDVPILTYKISATREFGDIKEDSITFVKYEKIDDQWKIISIESD